MNPASRHNGSIREYTSLVKPLAFLYTVIVLIAGMAVKSISDHQRDSRAEEIKLVDARGYITTDKGVRYFTECIEGRTFVITHAGYGMVAAGPIGECDD